MSQELHQLGQRVGMADNKNDLVGMVRPDSLDQASRVGSRMRLNGNF